MQGEKCFMSIRKHSLVIQRVSGMNGTAGPLCQAPDILTHAPEHRCHLVLTYYTSPHVFPLTTCEQVSPFHFSCILNSSTRFSLKFISALSVPCSPFTSASTLLSTHFWDHAVQFHSRKKQICIFLATMLKLVFFSLSLC